MSSRTFDDNLHVEKCLRLKISTIEQISISRLKKNDQININNLLKRLNLMRIFLNLSKNIEKTIFVQILLSISIRIIITDNSIHQNRGFRKLHISLQNNSISRKKIDRLSQI